MLGSSVGAARHPLGVLPLTVSADGSDATLALWVDEKPTSADWIVEAESTWLTADSEVFEKPIVEVAEDVNGSPSTRVVSCTHLLLCCSMLDGTFEVLISRNAERCGVLRVCLCALGSHEVRTCIAHL